MHARSRYGVSAVALAFTACAYIGTATAAPVWLQDYEAPGNLDEPFNRHPSFSGSSHGELDAGSAIVLNTTDGAIGTAQSATVTIVDDPAAPGDPAGTAYSIRFVPNAGANLGPTNPNFNTDGFVGFYLKAAPGLTGTVQVAPVLEDTGGTFDAAGGVLKTVVADGQWHLYEWNMDDPADFPNSFSDFFGAGGADVTLDAQAHFEAIAIIGTGVPTDVVLGIDQIGYNNAGSLVPEPATLSLAGLGLIGLLAARRRGR